MKRRIIFINDDSKGLSRSIRSCYGKCGFMSFLISTGHGITGVVEIYEDNPSSCNRQGENGRREET